MANIARHSGNEIDKYIGKQIQTYRQERLLSIESVALVLAMTSEDLQSAELGDLRLSASDFFTLKRYFNIPLQHFFSNDGQYFSDAIPDGSEMADVFHYFSNIKDSKIREHLLKQIKLASDVF